MNFVYHPRASTSYASPRRSSSSRSTSGTPKSVPRRRSRGPSLPPKDAFEKPTFVQQPPSNAFAGYNPPHNSQFYGGNDGIPYQQQQLQNGGYSVGPSFNQPGPSHPLPVNGIASLPIGPSQGALSQRSMNPTSNAPITKLELTLSAKNLRDRDVFSKSDPICVVFEATLHPVGLSWEEIGRTEQIQDCLNPEWITKIIINYMFEERQKIKFEVYDIDSDSKALSAHDFLGRAECDLADIVAAPFSTLAIPVETGKGSIIIHAEEIDEGQSESIKFVIKGRDLDKKDFFGKSDPFLSIYRPIADGTEKQLIHRTEVVKKTLNPDWQPFTLSVRALCAGNKDKEFIIECHDYDHDGDTKHDLIGVTKTTVNKLASGDIKELELINEKKKAKKGSKYKHSGILIFPVVKLQQEYTFLDYIHGGLELDFTVSVDFTASNGSITDHTSLHFCNPHSLNEYQMAIKAVLEICQAYNRTKNFTAFGFGAQVPPAYSVSHLFPLNLDTPEVFGIEGVMHAYATALRNINFHGPTNFAPTINEAAKRAAYYPPNGSKYQILLIITDGVISDIGATKTAIVKASTLPLSVIIIGVGKANFEKMNALDSDDSLLTAGGRSAKRDIVQFVPFRKFMKSEGNNFPYEQEKLQYLLAKEVLAEVPGQIISYMKSKNIAPRPPGEYGALNNGQGQQPGGYSGHPQPGFIPTTAYQVQNQGHYQSGPSGQYPPQSQANFLPHHQSSPYPPTQATRHLPNEPYPSDSQYHQQPRFSQDYGSSNPKYSLDHGPHSNYPQPNYSHDYSNPYPSQDFDGALDLDQISLSFNKNVNVQASAPEE